MQGTIVSHEYIFHWGRNIYGRGDDAGAGFVQIGILIQSSEQLSSVVSMLAS